jgi:hypothetical protein
VEDQKNNYDEVMEELMTFFVVIVWMWLLRNLVNKKYENKKAIVIKTKKLIA